jgi:hypothetical protein
MVVNRNGVWMRLAKPAVAFLLLLYGALPGICAGLCSAEICCDGEGARPAARKSCCQHANGPAAEIASAERSADCCSWIAERPNPQAADAKIVILLESLSAILAPAVRVEIPAETAAPRPIVPHDERGPPGPERTTSQPRAPPVCRV